MAESKSLSKMQKVRKRELRRATNRLHEEVVSRRGTGKGMDCYGLRVAITLISEMRKAIDHERAEDSNGRE